MAHCKERKHAGFLNPVTEIPDNIFNGKLATGYREGLQALP
jgi:hypothetical protein